MMLNNSKGRRIGHSRTLKLGGGGAVDPLAKLTARRGLFALLAIGLLAAGVAGFFVSGAVAQAQEQETALPSTYDTDGDGLIEISNTAQLNAVRWDLDGNGVGDRASNGVSYYRDYAAAFPVADGGSVCPSDTTCTGYELTTDLDFDANGDGEITTADPYPDWSSIGRWPRPFNGDFDGNGYTIANLRTKAIQDVGLFGRVGPAGHIRNLGLRGVDVSGDRLVGGLVGYNSGTITASYVAGSVGGGAWLIGGLVGRNHGTISASYATVSVSGGDGNVGGLVGFNSGTISASYALGSVTGRELVGGLVGNNGSSYGSNPGTINASYALGTVAGNEYVGGLVGFNDGTISASYYDSDISGHDGPEGRTTDELTSPTGSTGIYADWPEVWDFRSDAHYPVLKADFDGDNTASWQEFGYQVRGPLLLTVTTSGTQASLTWENVTETAWTGMPRVSYVVYRDGQAITAYDSQSLAYTDVGLDKEVRYTYQVALLLDGVEHLPSNTSHVFLGVPRKDSDGDGLIDVDNLDQLYEMVSDWDGNGAADYNYARYSAAFPAATDGPACISGHTCQGYELTRNLDFNDPDSYASGSTNMAAWAKGDGSSVGWIPHYASFSGTFDGNGHVIANLYVDDDRNLGDYAGLFWWIGHGGVVRNLGLVGVDITVDVIAGGLAGYNEGRINGSYVTGSVTSSGGGGLVGENGGTIIASYATGSVNGNWSAGGLVGWNRGAISTSYATGSVTGNNATGGLVGNNTTGGTITASYYDLEVSGQADAVGKTRGSGTSEARGESTAALQSPTGYTGIYADWNLDLDGDGNADDPWDFGTASQYPALKADSNGDDTATWQEFGHQVRRPLTLTASVSGLQATLNWDDITETAWSGTPQVSYVLYRDGAAMTGYDGASLSHVDAGLTLGQEYAYRVALLLDGVEHRRSNIASVTPISEPLSFGDVRHYDYTWRQNMHNGRLDLPRATGGVAPLTYTVSPDLPAGLVFDAGYLTINGIPTESQARVHYAYTVTDANGDTASLSFSILVLPPPITVSAGQPATVREGDAVTYQVSVDAQPAENVVVAVSSDNSDVAVQPSSLTFTTDNWQTAQTVTVSAAHDGDREDEQAVIRHQVSGLTVASVTVNVTDDESDREILRDFYNATGGANWTDNDGWLSNQALNQWHGVSTNGQGQVTQLSLRNNGLSGSLPAQLGKMESLEVLSLDRNSISGSLPVELGELSNLTRLAMNRNQLTGAIPTELGSLSNLSIVGLARNQLSGALPASLGDLTGLTRLSLHDNTGLSGPLPSGFTNLADLERLAIANTGLCAPDDEGFSDWLDGVADKPGGVQTCGSP